MEKERIRRYIWDKMERENIAKFPRPVYHRIPNFIGSEIAGRRVIQSKIFENAEIVFCNPDSPQRIIREYVIRSGKTLIMASPRLRSGFIILEKKYVPRGRERRASTIAGAFRYGRIVEYLHDIHIDLKVTGSVAVTIDGGRVGKGGGFSDLEYALLREFGVIDEDTPIVTTVHEVQIVEYIPMTRHDVPVDIIFTPSRRIDTSRKYPKPSGIYWDELDIEKINSIPILRKLYQSRGIKNA